MTPGFQTGLRSDECEKLASKTALDWKEKGNAAFKANDSITALRAYSQALDACSVDDTDLRRTLLRNRATVNTTLERFEAALTDSRAAITSGDERLDEAAIALNAKAHYRAGRAAYELRRFDEAQYYFMKVLQLTPSDKDGSIENSRVEQRIKEQTIGQYDFTSISKSTSKKHNRLDRADFTSNTVVREAGSHGNGLFATENIAAGQLIMCEKAFSVSFESDPEASKSYAILNYKTQRGATDTQATLLFRLVSKLLPSPILATNIFDLADGGYTPKLPTELVDNVVPVDTFRIQAILSHNCYACPTVRSSSKTARAQSISGAGHPSSGLWWKASYINHACDGNAMRAFMGDLMILRATKDISQGDEILMPYRLPNADNTATQDELEKIWGFRCDCEICTTEAVTPFRQRKERLQLLEKVTDLMTAHPASRSSLDKASVAKAERLFTQIEKTYNKESFDKRPRLGLVVIGKWLYQAYSLDDGSHDKVIVTALGLLRNKGIIVTITEKKVEIDRRYCQLDSIVIHAAMQAANAFRKKAEDEIGEQMEGFARDTYLVMNGEMRDFEEIHGNP